jgi:hypothetical protein
VSAHEHHWKPALHADGCHFYEWRYGCHCGAVKITYAERDVKTDPYSYEWMDPINADEPCLRCGELLAGAEPKHREEILEPKRSAA